MLKLYYIFIFFLIISFQSLAQEKANSPLHFDHLTINEGLSHNTVYSMIQDSYGYIWIGTQNGLNKYDGYSFKVFRGNSQLDNNGFKGKIITALFEDSEGNLWVGTRKNGINIKKRSNNQFENLKSDRLYNEIKDAWVTSFLEDRDGNIWIGTRGKGLLKFNPKTQSTKLYSTSNNNLINDEILDIKEDKYETIWIASYANGLSYIEKKYSKRANFSNYVEFPSYGGNRKNILIDDDKLWIGAEGTGVYIMNINLKKFSHITEGKNTDNLSSNFVRNIHKGKNGHIYIATDGGGLNVYNPSNKEIYKYNYLPNYPTTLNTDALFCFLEDRIGNLWIGTYNGGINIHKNTKTWFDFITPDLTQGEELKHKSILAIHEDKMGMIWLGTDGGGLKKLIEKNNQLYFSPHDNIFNNGSKVVKSIFQDSENNLWIGSFGEGLEMYNSITKSSKKFKAYDGENSIKSSSVWTINEDTEGNMWFGTLGGGISILNKETKLFRHIHKNPNDPGSLLDENIMVISKDKENRIWVGTMDSGLSVWNNKTQNFTHYQNIPNDTTSISGNEIRSIYTDSKGKLWIGTEDGGLNLYLGNGKFKRITKEHGLIANSVMGITEDKEGFIWITTYVGTSRLNPNNNQIRNFDFHTKQNNNQFNQMSILTSSSGQLLFGGINGLNSIKLEHIKEDDGNSNIIFTKFKIFNKEIEPGRLSDGRTILKKTIEEAEKINLDYSDNSFSIEFAAMDYTNSLNYDFNYRMKGFNSEWQQTKKGIHSVSYTNLDPGNYTFQVKLNDKMIAVQVIITPPFWDTIWFKLLSIFIILSILIGTAYFFLKRREESHKQKLLEAESEILQLKNDKLATEVSSKNAKLMFSSIQMAHKNEVLTVVKKDLEKGMPNPNNEIRALLRMIDSELENEDYWKDFNVYFNQVDRDFVQSLNRKHPNLTQNDIRICTLIRLQLTTKEIASLLNVTSRAVEKSRSRLKKRLELEPKQNLLKYILDFKIEN